MWIQTYQISQRYNFTATIGDSFSQKIVPSGGLDVTTIDISTSANNLKPVIQGNHQADWDSKFSDYHVTVAFVTVGTMLQIFLFSDAFSSNMVYSK